MADFNHSPKESAPATEDAYDVSDDRNAVEKKVDSLMETTVDAGYELIKEDLQTLKSIFSKLNADAPPKTKTAGEDYAVVGTDEVPITVKEIVLSAPSAKKNLGKISVQKI